MRQNSCRHLLLSARKEMIKAPLAEARTLSDLTQGRTLIAQLAEHLSHPGDGV